MFMELLGGPLRFLRSPSRSKAFLIWGVLGHAIYREHNARLYVGDPPKRTGSDGEHFGMR